MANRSFVERVELFSDGFCRRILGNSRALVIVSVYSIAHLGIYFYRYALNPASDIFSAWPAPRIAEWLGKTDEFYTGSATTQFHEGLSWSYGPMLHVITLPLFLLPDRQTAYTVLVCVVFAIYLLVGVMLVLRFSGGDRPLSVVMIFVLFNFAPAYEATGQGNIEMFELLLLTLAIVASRHERKHETLTGVLIGVAAGLKFLPGFLIPYFFLTKRWKAAIASTATVGIIGISTQAILGWQNSALMNRMLDVNHEENFLDHPLNQAASGFLIRTTKALGREALGVPMSIAAMLGLGIGICVWLWRRRNEKDWEVHWSVLLTTSVLVIPHNESYYFCLLLIPYSVALQALRADGRKTLWALYGLSFAMVGWGIPMSIVNSAVDTILGRHIWVIQRLHEVSVPFIGAVMLLALLLIIANRPEGEPSDLSKGRPVVDAVSPVRQS